MEYRIVESIVGEELWHFVVEHSPQTVRHMENPSDGGNYLCFLAVGSGKTFLGLSVIDIGPMHFGPLAADTVGFLENILVLPPYRRRDTLPTRQPSFEASAGGSGWRPRILLRLP